VIRALAVLVGVVAALAASVAAFAAIRAVGPANRTGDFGFGKAATVAPSGGTLFETRNFARVLTALERELGRGGAVQSLNVTATGATGYGRAGGHVRVVNVDASGRSKSYDAGAVTPAAQIPIARIDAAAIDKLVRGARRETAAPLKSLDLDGQARQWDVEMDSGEPDRFTANLDGGGLRLPGEPNPEPTGANADSLLRTANLTRVLAAVRKEAADATRVTSLDIRPDRVTVEVEERGRSVELTYGYDAQLTSRDISALTGDPHSIALEAIDPTAVERMAATARQKVKSHGLADVQYVLLDVDGVLKPHPQLSLYLPTGSDPGYVVADLHGRGLTWPGRK
jgi:hypothetical protein